MTHDMLDWRACHAWHVAESSFTMIFNLVVELILMMRRTCRTLALCMSGRADTETRPSVRVVPRTKGRAGYDDLSVHLGADFAVEHCCLCGRGDCPRADAVSNTDIWGSRTRFIFRVSLCDCGPNSSLRDMLVSQSEFE